MLRLTIFTNLAEAADTDAFDPQVFRARGRVLDGIDGAGALVVVVSAHEGTLVRDDETTHGGGSRLHRRCPHGTRGSWGFIDTPGGEEEREEEKGKFHGRDTLVT
jgi:hypothetical protein